MLLKVLPLFTPLLVSIIGPTHDLNGTHGAQHGKTELFASLGIRKIGAEIMISPSTRLPLVQSERDADSGLNQIRHSAGACNCAASEVTAYSVVDK